LVHLVDSVDPYAISKDPSEVELMKNTFYTTALQGLQQQYIHTSASSSAEKLEKEAVIILPLRLSPDLGSQRGALEMLRRVKAKLGHTEVVCLPAQRSSRSATIA
jgi:hypothetical protein